jgi:hypothetical protein
MMALCSCRHVLKICFGWQVLAAHQALKNGLKYRAWLIVCEFPLRTILHYPDVHQRRGGQFRKDGEFWDFSLGQEPSVRDIYLDIFGEFEVLAPRTVLHCKGPLDALIDEGTNSESLYIAGMKVASITRKGRLWLAQTATVIKGTVGVNESPKKITSTPETRIDIQGVPESLALKLNQRYPDQVSYSLL